MAVGGLCGASGSSVKPCQIFMAVGVLMFSDKTVESLQNGARCRPTAASLLVFLLLFTKRLLKESPATWACLYSVGRLFKCPAHSYIRPDIGSKDLYDVTNYRLTGSASYSLTGKLSTEQLRHFCLKLPETRHRTSHKPSSIFGLTLCLNEHALGL